MYSYFFPSFDELERPEEAERLDGRGGIFVSLPSRSEPTLRTRVGLRPSFISVYSSNSCTRTRTCRHVQIHTHNS